MRQSNEWVKFIQRYPKNSRGGGLIKIDSGTLMTVLQEAKISLDKELQVKRYPAVGKRGVAKIILELRVLDAES